MTNTATTQHLQISETLYQQGRYLESMESAQRASVGREGAPWRELLLARCYHRLWWAPQAEASYLSARDLARQRLGEQHSIVADSLDGLGKLYLEQAAPRKAALLIEEAHTLRQVIFGAEHPDTAESLLHLAELYTELSQYNTALPFYQEALRILRLFGGEAQLATALNCFGYFYWLQSRLSEALVHLTEAKNIQERVLPERHPAQGSTLWNLALVHRDQGELNQATELLQRAVAVFSDALGINHPKAYCSLHELGALYQLVGRDEDRVALYQRALRSPIKEEAAAIVKARRRGAKPPSWRLQKTSWGELSLYSGQAAHLCLAADVLTITSDDAVRSLRLPDLAPLASLQTDVTRESFFAVPGDVFVVTQDRLMHHWRDDKYLSYVGALPHGPLVGLSERRQLLCVEQSLLSLRSLDDLSEVARQELSLGGAEVITPVFSSAGFFVGGALLGQEVLLYDAQTLEEIDSFEVQGSLRALAVSGVTIFAATESWISVYQRNTEEAADSAWALSAVVPELIAASYDAALLAIASREYVSLYDTKTHQEITRLSIAQVEQLLFHPTQKILLLRTQEQRAYALRYS